MTVGVDSCLLLLLGQVALAQVYDCGIEILHSTLFRSPHQTTIRIRLVRDKQNDDPAIKMTGLTKRKTPTAGVRAVLICD
jgi:hypothetical protein